MRRRLSCQEYTDGYCKCVLSTPFYILPLTGDLQLSSCFRRYSGVLVAVTKSCQSYHKSNLENSVHFLEAYLEKKKSEFSQFQKGVEPMTS